MRRYAILTLQAPMMSFGGDAVDSRRPTGAFPGRSMLTGLVGNALGWRRQDHNQLQALQERIRYAARMEHNDSIAIMQDFQTVELSKDDLAWTTNGTPEGREGSSDTYKGPEIRLLEYITDCRAIVAMRLEKPEEHPILEEVSQALQLPARPLHIGRKCCIPEAMVFTGYQDAETATSALQKESSQGTWSMIQWDPGEGGESVRLAREHWTSDLRDWANRVPAGRRRVIEGSQCAEGDEE
jgi:CRISPR system Cascade subunit CasD